MFEGLEESLRAVVREEVERAMTMPRETTEWLNARSAAEYMDTTEEAIRGLVKRRQIPCHRSENGRLLFRRDELDVWAAGEAV